MLTGLELFLPRFCPPVLISASSRVSLQGVVDLFLVFVLRSYFSSTHKYCSRAYTRVANVMNVPPGDACEVGDQSPQVLCSYSVVVAARWKR